ncbi:MAG TPA: YraN family protein [Dokdonella sp.]
MNARSAGAGYEDVALAHLEKAGLVLLARNFNCRYGEIDLVMSEHDIVVFVEVRYRRGAGLRGGYGDGVDSVSAGKRAKLVRAAEVFLAGHARLAQRPCRFDVFAIADGTGAPVIDWRRNAFDAY